MFDNGHNNKKNLLGLKISGIDLSRISVLVVEDSPFIRTLIVNSIRILGVQTVRSVDDGAEAIEFLKLVDEQPMKAGMMSVDIIICDWEMSPVNGLLLGHIPRDRLSRIINALAAEREKNLDPGLVQIINDIELRAKVELAKLEYLK